MSPTAAGPYLDLEGYGTRQICGISQPLLWPGPKATSGALFDGKIGDCDHQERSH